MKGTDVNSTFVLLDPLPHTHIHIVAYITFVCMCVYRCRYSEECNLEMIARWDYITDVKNTSKEEAAVSHFFPLDFSVYFIHFIVIVTDEELRKMALRET